MAAQGNNHVFVTIPPLGPEPVRMTCPFCRHHITTEIEHKISTKTNMLCVVLSLFGLFLCAPCVYCLDYFKSKEHWCPKCLRYLGTYDG